MRPKFQLGKKERKYIATKKFTDREYPREVFAKRVDRIIHRSPTHSENDVIIYYGIGGIGKSSLQSQLKVELLEQVPNSLFTSIDFMDPMLHYPARALLELTENIKFKHKLSFPHFEIAYSLYFCKRNPDITFNEKQLPFKAEMNILSSIAGALDGLGIVGATAGIVDKLYETKKKWGLNKDIKEQLKDLENCSLQEIENRLPAFFSYDFQAGISKHQIPVSAIFIDTYEAIWLDVKNNATKYTKDEWVRELVAQLPNVLFVICGREYLEWETSDSEWKEILEHHILGNLSQNDADVFLDNCGIKEDAIRLKMIKASDGHPYHLDLSVDTYFELKNREENLLPDLFGSNKREIFDRFLRYLSDEEIETLKIISIPRFYDRKIFTYLISHFKTGYSTTKFDDFNKFSFITIEEEKCYIHALMRESMLSYTSVDLIKEAHTMIADYYSHLLSNDISLKSNNDKEIIVLEENLYHKKRILSPQQFSEWLKSNRVSYLKKYQLRGEVRFLFNLLKDIYDSLGAKKMDLSLFTILVDVIHLSGNYELAVKHINEYYKGMPLVKIINSKENSLLWVRKYHHQMFFSPVQPLIQEMLILEPLLNKKFNDEYNEVLFMLGGNLGLLHGDLKFSRSWLIKSIRLAQKTGQANYLCRALRKYADVLRLKGHFKWAKICTQQGIQIAKDNGFERYESYLLCTFGDILRSEENYDEATQYFEEALVIIKKRGIRGWEGHINSALAEIAFQKEDFFESAKYYNYANKIYKQVNQQWGIVISSLGLLRCKQNNEYLELENIMSIEEIMRITDYLNYKREFLLAKNTKERMKIEKIQLIFL